MSHYLQPARRLRRHRSTFAAFASQTPLPPNNGAATLARTANVPAERARRYFGGSNIVLVPNTGCPRKGAAA